jgi:hypothetical protein
MAKRLMLWSISKAVVDFDTVADDDIKESLLACKFAVRLGLISVATRDLPAFHLVFDTSFMDADPSAYFLHESFLIPFDRSDKANTVTAHCQDHQLKLSITCQFEVDLVDGIDDATLRKWIDSNQLWTYIRPSGSWAYANDEGGQLVLL